MCDAHNRYIFKKCCSYFVTVENQILISADETRFEVRPLLRAYQMLNFKTDYS